MNKKLPFSEEGETRKFSKDVDSHELKWHRDKEDRVVTPLEKNDWLFQREDCVPQPLEGEIRIAKGEWHRVIKGTTDLVVHVMKEKNEI